MNEPFKTIKMNATAGRSTVELFVLSAVRITAAALPAILAAACAQDEAVPAHAPAPAAVSQPPIVDMSSSARRPLVPNTTPVLPAEPAGEAGRPARVVPERGAAVVTARDVAELRARGLIVPVRGVEPRSLVASFGEARGAGGARAHEALDIAAPRGTPVLATDDGTVLKLHTSRAGGLTIYVADPTKRFIYYYAHLDSYAPTLVEGQAVAKGQRIASVGTTGNAPPGTPHLHFAILRNDDMTKWWTGTPLDPYKVLR